ncbi:MAG: zinc finger domain-containing protein [Paracoccaceae bacterium]
MFSDVPGVRSARFERNRFGSGVPTNTRMHRFGSSGVRGVANAMMEFERTAKNIGSSLEAKLLVRVPHDEQLALLQSVDLQDLFIVSDLTLEKGRPVNDDGTPFGPNFEGVGVKVLLAEGEKCQRCWKILPDVGSHAHPGVCGRCDAALA